MEQKEIKINGELIATYQINEHTLFLKVEHAEMHQTQILEIENLCIHLIRVYESDHVLKMVSYLNI